MSVKSTLLYAAELHVVGAIECLDQIPRQEGDIYDWTLSLLDDVKKFISEEIEEETGGPRVV